MLLLAGLARFLVTDECIFLTFFRSAYHFGRFEVWTYNILNFDLKTFLHFAKILCLEIQLSQDQTIFFDCNLNLVFLNQKHTLIHISIFIICIGMSQTQNKEPIQNDTRKRQSEEKEKRDQYFKEFNAHRSKMLPLIKFLKKHGLKFKHARVTDYSVQYFRVNELNQLVQDKKSVIEASPSLSEALKFLPTDVTYFQRTRNQPNLKYPQLLEPSGASGKFASFKYDINESRRWLVFVIIIAVFLGVLFPLWPFVVKYYLWLASLYLLTTLLGLIGLRLLVYTFFGVFGYSFWIFPNLFGDCGILESFKPIHSISRWDTGVCSMIFRVLALCFVGYYGYHIYLDPSFIFENLQISKTTFNEVHDWGVDKIKGEHGNFSQRALTNLDTILNQTEELNETSFDQGTTFGQNADF